MKRYYSPKNLQTLSHKLTLFSLPRLSWQGACSLSDGLRSSLSLLLDSHLQQFVYSPASALDLAIFAFTAALALFLCNVNGVTTLCTFAPGFLLTGGRLKPSHELTYGKTESSWTTQTTCGSSTLFGPRILGTSVSVNLTRPRRLT